MKRIAIMALFAVIFGGAMVVVFYLRGNPEPVPEQKGEAQQPLMISDSVHSYTVADLRSGCDVDDKIFCAVELAVKCTLEPTLAGCVKERIPNFILVRPDITDRPKEMSFAITKIKPSANGGDMFVYTNSSCDAVWFGLCEGTVVYSLAKSEGEWGVNNIYALE